MSSTVANAFDPVTLTKTPNYRADSPSLRDAAYEQIKHHINTCRFKPGDYLNEAFISSIVGIGRTPVRQAIDQLMQDGMLEVIPRKGVIVKPISFEDVIDINDIRKVNEDATVRLAAERADSNDIARISDVLKRSALWGAVGDIEQMMLLDLEFHIAIARATRNEILQEIVQKLNERSLRFWFISLSGAEHCLQVLSEHQLIFDAIRRHDADAAGEAMANHINSFQQNISQHL